MPIVCFALHELIALLSFTLKFLSIRHDNNYYQCVMTAQDVDGVHDQHREVIIPHHSGWLNTLDTSDADCLYQNTTVAISHAVPEVVVLNECEGEFEVRQGNIFWHFLCYVLPQVASPVISVA